MPSAQNRKPKIHLVFMPYFRLDVPPLSVACLYAYVKKHNFDVSFTDFRLVNNDARTFTYLGYQDNYVMETPDLPLILAITRNFRENKPLLLDIDQVIEEYIRDRPLSFFKLKRSITDVYHSITENVQQILDHDIISFTTYDTNFFFTIMCSLVLRQHNPNIPIVYGGPQVTQSENSRKLVLKLGLADVVATGEGEKTFLEITEAISSGKSPAVKGTTTYDKDKDLFFTQSADPLDIDTLPCPDFSILDLSGYPNKNFVLPLYSSRGCVYRCSFCNEWKMWSPFRRLSSDRVIEWMNQLNRLHGAFRFYFADSLLNASMSWLEEFADKLLLQGLDFQWYGYFRAKMSKKLAEKLKRSGLCRAFIGAESFSQTRLQGMNKKNTVTANLEAVEAFCSSDVPLEVSSIIGFPDESESDFNKCWEFYLHSIKKYPLGFIMNIEPFQLRPSSSTYENPDDYGLSTTQWSTEVIDMIPDVSDIVRRIPMSVDGRPQAQQIVHRMNIMKSSFSLDKETETRAGIYHTKSFLKMALKYMEPSYRVLLITPNVIVIPVESQGVLGNGLFLLHWENGKHVITQEEKIMLDGFNGQMPLANIVEKLSIQFEKNRENCMESVLIFLNELLERDILFEISP